MDQQLQEFEERLNTQFTKIDRRFEEVEGRLADKIDAVGVKVGVLHEDVKADFRFSLEALQGVQQQLERQIAEESQTTRAMLTPIADAVRHGQAEV